MHPQSGSKMKWENLVKQVDFLMQFGYNNTRY